MFVLSSLNIYVPGELTKGDVTRVSRFEERVTMELFTSSFTNSCICMTEKIELAVGLLKILSGAHTKISTRTPT